MKTKQLNMELLRASFEQMTEENPDHILFLRIPNARLFRVMRVPDMYADDPDVAEMLKTLCLHYHQATNTYFFTGDSEDINDIIHVFWLHEIECILMEPQRIETNQIILNPN